MKKKKKKERKIAAGSQRFKFSFPFSSLFYSLIYILPFIEKFTVVYIGSIQMAKTNFLVMVNLGS